nr:immunoglobulin light chain junction region [Homo sapiens]
AVYYCQQYYST